MCNQKKNTDLAEHLPELLTTFLECINQEHSWSPTEKQ